MNGGKLPVLEQIRIASPCHVRWEEMSGDEKSRHCGLCNLQVHNLSAMTRVEAEALVMSAAGERRMCVRLYKRADGTLITQDCPVGLAAARLRVRRVAVRVAAAFGLMAGSSVAGVAASTRPGQGTVRLRGLNPIAAIVEWLAPSPPPVPGPTLYNGQMEMGRLCIPPAPAPSGS